MRPGQRTLALLAIMLLVAGSVASFALEVGPLTVLPFLLPGVLVAAASVRHKSYKDGLDVALGSTGRIIIAVLVAAVLVAFLESDGGWGWASAVFTGLVAINVIESLMATSGCSSRH